MLQTETHMSPVTSKYDGFDFPFYDAICVLGWCHLHLVFLNPKQHEYILVYTHSEKAKRAHHNCIFESSRRVAFDVCAEVNTQSI